MWVPIMYDNVLSKYLIIILNYKPRFHINVCIYFLLKYFKYVCLEIDAVK